MNDPSRKCYPPAAFPNEEQARAADAARVSIAEWLRGRERDTQEGSGRGAIVWWEPWLAQGRREEQEFLSWMEQACADQRLKKAQMLQDAQLELCLLRLGGEGREPVALDTFRADIQVAKACSAGTGASDPLIAVPLSQVPAGMDKHSVCTFRPLAIGMPSAQSTHGASREPLGHPSLY